MGKTIIHRQLPNSTVAFVCAQAMEDCGVSVFSITCDSKSIPYSVFSVWGKSSVNKENSQALTEKIDQFTKVELDKMATMLQIDSEKSEGEKEGE